ncbi:MAG: cysteine--1-D-myo-inosityl 2-amino-2-deoxy-alpha-D-glucopyranoside ligase [Dermatophilus congolensis]|nr:cysteine--1-D-myo-inosityl 2-amino-2-deoxy-alpha-D-glucopyranoside ligase [Dermatophilus congolensis]
MRSWAATDVPDLRSAHGVGIEPRITDSSTGTKQPVGAGETARLYICGITPYDATHMGHAATYVMFDLLHRVLLDAGHEVVYCENVTDVDDPLLERADRDNIKWRALAERETDLFRSDMAALRVLPPNHFIGVAEYVHPIGAAVAKLMSTGDAYSVPVTDGTGVYSSAHDIYLDLSKQPSFGKTSGWSREQMMEVFADRGGDPDREGKQTPLDPLLWRAAREGEPAWYVDGVGAGRPGWHIECTSIALDHLGTRFDVQAGGVDLVFPHHEMSAVQADALYGEGSFARLYLHQEMVGLDGEKMSKSKGNLVFVSKLRYDLVDPMVIRLALLAHHYATPWDWTDQVLADASARLALWRTGVPSLPAEAQTALVGRLRECLADDLDSPGALAAVDAALAAAEGAPAGDSPNEAARAIDALLGVAL